MDKNQNQLNKTIKERSAAYPGIPVDQAVLSSIKLQNAFGKSPFSRESAVKQMGYTTVTGTSGMRVAALVHYGLLKRDGSSYRNSELSLRVTHPVDEEDRKNAIKSAAVSPKLYKTLIDSLSGRAIPTALSSILIQHHKIGTKVAGDVADVFRKTIEYAGLYVNGIVLNDFYSTESENDVESVNLEGSMSSNSKLDSNLSTSTLPTCVIPSINQPGNQGFINLDLPSGLVISYPKILAYSFAMGIFAKEVVALETAIQKELNKKNNTIESDTETNSSDE